LHQIIQEEWVGKAFQDIRCHHQHTPKGLADLPEIERARDIGFGLLLDLVLQVTDSLRGDCVNYKGMVKTRAENPAGEHELVQHGVEKAAE
jgi:hypothetical protein